MPCMLVTLDTSHLEISPLNDFAPENMSSILVTLDTSHLERSPLNSYALGIGSKSLTNNLLISVTAETSQDPIGFDKPFAPSKGDISSVSTMASWSCALDLRTHTAVVQHLCSQMGGLGFWASANARILYECRGLCKGETECYLRGDSWPNSFGCSRRQQQSNFIIVVQTLKYGQNWAGKMCCR